VKTRSSGDFATTMRAKGTQGVAESLEGRVFASIQCDFIEHRFLEPVIFLRYCLCEQSALHSNQFTRTMLRHILADERRQCLVFVCEFENQLDVFELLISVAHRINADFISY
jgi:hypothetical protein